MRKLSEAGQATYEKYLNVCELVDLHEGFRSAVAEILDYIDSCTGCSLEYLAEMEAERDLALEDAAHYWTDAYASYSTLCTDAAVTPKPEEMFFSDGRVDGGAVTRAAFEAAGEALTVEDRMAMIDAERSRSTRRHALPREAVVAWERDYADAQSEPEPNGHESQAGHGSVRQPFNASVVHDDVDAPEESVGDFDYEL